MRMQKNAVLCNLFQPFRLLQPEICDGIGGHTPVAPRRERDRADLNAVGKAGTLELLREETPVKADQPFFDGAVFIPARKGVLREKIYFGGGKAPADRVIEEKSCSSYGPTSSSVFCAIFPSSGGSSSGLISVSRISRSTFSASPPSRFASLRMRYFTSVLGTEAFTPYMDIWSPLYVAQPSASSLKSPVPTTMPPTSLAISMRTRVRTRACAFS